MRRMFSIVMALVLAGGIVAVPEAASAATRCSTSWHYITHGETGLNVRPHPLMWQGDTGLYADGVPGDDFWNQQFLFCRDPGWGANHYGIFSNLTRGYWGVTDYGSVYAGDPAIEDRYQLFEIRRYDSTWWTIRWLGGWPTLTYYVCPQITVGEGWPRNPLRTTGPPLTGNHLFKITPSNLLG